MNQLMYDIERVISRLDCLKEDMHDDDYAIIYKHLAGAVEHIDEMLSREQDEEPYR